MFCACEIQLYYTVVCVFTAVYKFDFRFVINTYHTVTSGKKVVH